jgi:hypothetical protein
VSVPILTGHMLDIRTLKPACGILDGSILLGGRCTEELVNVATLSCLSLSHNFMFIYGRDIKICNCSVLL